jgi:hypothetical protein
MPTADRGARVSTGPTSRSSSRRAGDRPLPIPATIFGHGLFGSAEDYLDDATTARNREHYCYVVIGGDWIGLTSARSRRRVRPNLNRSTALIELSQGDQPWRSPS